MSEPGESSGAQPSLSPEEIESRTFSRRVSGYSSYEVTAFLQAVAAAYRQALSSDGLVSLEAARATARQLLSQAETEAAVIRQEAIHEADAVLATAKERAQDLDRRTAEILAAAQLDAEDIRRRMTAERESLQRSCRLLEEAARQRADEANRRAEQAEERLAATEAEIKALTAAGDEAVIQMLANAEADAADVRGAADEYGAEVSESARQAEAEARHRADGANRRAEQAEERLAATEAELKALVRVAAEEVSTMVAKAEADADEVRRAADDVLKAAQHVEAETRQRADEANRRLGVAQTSADPLNGTE
ncbi:MAG: DivIVA domain-containing protein [Actinomycetota bacterium]|nr:DivIVA domain-containing protein [Actinomycetota bacterium]MDQ3642731.1 DivIVA domain-containing protein [Actinomycetota bacterium]